MKYRNDIKTRFTARHKRSIQLAGEVYGKNLLNIGCGIGWYEKAVAELRCKLVVGIDIDLKAIESAKRETNPRICQFVNVSATHLPFRECYFDTVSLFEVLEHVPYGSEFIVLSQAREVLVPNGELLLSTPMANLVAIILDPGFFLVGHRHYSPRMIQTLLAEVRFLTRIIFCTGGLVELISTIALYFFKYLLNREIPFKETIERLKSIEYNKKGFVTIFVKATKR